MAQAAYKTTTFGEDNIIHANFGNTPKKQNKKSDKSSEVFPYTVEELKAMITYFDNHYFDRKNGYIHKLVLITACNTARRIGDILNLTWGDIFDSNGNFRDEFIIKEEKTDKWATPVINEAVREAVNEYLKKTGYTPIATDHVFTQLRGPYKGRLLTSGGHLKALKDAAKSCGITKNIGTHSARKTYGSFLFKLHPQDPYCKSLLQASFGHSSEAITMRYIGLERERINGYYKDMSDFFTRYIVGGEEVQFADNANMLYVDANDLRCMLAMAYEQGMDGDKKSPMAVVNALNEIMSVIEKAAK